MVVWEDPVVSSHLGHILSDNVEAALLLHDHPQQLHQVAVSELPAQQRKAQGREQEGTETTSIHKSPSHCHLLCVLSPPPSHTHVITDASARKACAVASFLMHLTATLFPR